MNEKERAFWTDMVEHARRNAGRGLCSIDAYGPTILAADAEMRQLRGERDAAAEDARQMQERLSRVVEENKRLRQAEEVHNENEDWAAYEGAREYLRALTISLDVEPDREMYRIARRDILILAQHLKATDAVNDRMHAELAQHDANCECAAEAAEAAELRYTAAEVRAILCHACALGVPDRYDAAYQKWLHQVNNVNVPCLADAWRKAR